MSEAFIQTTSTKYPQKTAVIDGPRRITYEQLAASIGSFANELTAAGVTEGESIALVLPNCAEFVIGFYSTLHIGAVVLALNPLLKHNEINYYLADAQARVILTTKLYMGMCREIVAAAGRSIEIIALDGVLEGSRAAASERAAPAAADPHRPALFQYSSGSTGRPKKVMRTYGNLCAEGDNFTATVGMTHDDVILCLVPLFHAHGLGNCLLAATMVGATLVILEQPMDGNAVVDMPFIARCARVFELIEIERVSVLPGVPYVFSALSSAQVGFEPALGSLRLCFSAGNFLTRDVFDAFLDRFGIAIKQLYGCTEAGSVPINLEDDPSLAASVGLPIRNVELHICDEQKNRLAPDAIGEIAFKSPMLTSGYVGLEDINRDMFRDGFFFTGDLGRLDEAGRLTITGRKKIFIDVGGRKVDPLEIEDVLLTHPRVKEAVVVGIKAPYGGEFAKAVAVLDGECTQTELLQYCKDRLADFKVPRMIEFRNEIPKSPLGKILRKNLVDDSAVAEVEALGSTLSQHMRSTSSREQRLSLAKQCVRQQIARISGLDVAQIGLSNALSDFGLDSARAIELQMSLENLMGAGLSATMVWQYPDLDSLSGYLVDIVDAQTAGADPAAVPDRAAAPPAARPSAIQAIDDLSDDAIEALLRSQVDGILQPQNTTNAHTIPGLNEGDSAGIDRLAQLSDEDVTDLLLKEFARLSRTGQPEA